MNAAFAVFVVLLAQTPLAYANGIGEGYRSGSLTVFGVIVLIGLVVATLARRRAPSHDRRAVTVSALAGGFALAGDYLSAASFLGVAGLVALWGFDGLIYPLGWLVAFLSVTMLIAEPCRNLACRTPADLLACRFDPRAARFAGALSSIVLLFSYLVAQMVAGGMLLSLVTGADYQSAVLAVGALVIVYVLLGGVMAAAWVQIAKALLLVGVCGFLVLLTVFYYGSPDDFLLRLLADQDIQQRVATLLGDTASQMTPDELGRRFLSPGLLQQSPLDQVSLAMALVFGAAGLPHILTRFYAMPGIGVARQSLFRAMLIIAVFYAFAVLLGFEAATRVGGEAIVRQDPGGNMALPLLAQALSGGSRGLAGNLLLAFVVAVAFVMIVAVMVSQLRAAATSVAQDLYPRRWRKASTDGRQMAAVLRWSMLGVGLAAIALGVAAQGSNVAVLVALVFAFAASTNFPAILLALHWRLATTAGVMAGMLAGGSGMLALVLVSPLMNYPQQVKAEARHVLESAAARRQFVAAGLANPDRVIQERARLDALRLDRSLRQARLDLERYRDEETSLVGLAEPLIGLRNPALWSLPFGLLTAILISLLTTDRRARERWSEIRVRQVLGSALGGSGLAFRAGRDRASEL